MIRHQHQYVDRLLQLVELGVSFLWLLNKHTCISHSTKESEFQALTILTTTKKEQLRLGDIIAIIFVRLSNNLAHTFTRGLERDFDRV
jgi:hypothetical protein